MNRFPSIGPSLATAHNHFISGETSNVEVELSGVKAGIVEVANVRVDGLHAELAREIRETCTRLRDLHSFDSLRQWEPVRAVRKMFCVWGEDPSKYRPSSEALLRRIVKGSELPQISNIVDIANLCAIEMAWPYGCYDRKKISGPIAIRRGKIGEEYEGIGRQLFSLEGRPVFSDSLGPFGSPISDSRRTMVTESTNELFVIICAPESSGSTVLEGAMAKLVERLVLWCSASGIRTRTVGPAAAHASHANAASFSST
jgi:DNA/RNA-binding domain of Phe-tRNA-synthetase-like protein